MDPHKDFVKVDDAFRQLKESSDDEMPAGAWLRMRDILDASLPVGVAVTRYSWKQYLLPVFIAVFIGSSAILGYNFYQKEQKSKEQNVIANLDLPKALTGQQNPVDNTQHPGPDKTIASNSPMDINSHSNLSSGTAQHNTLSNNAAANTNSSINAAASGNNRNKSKSADNTIYNSAAVAKNETMEQTGANVIDAGSTPIANQSAKAKEEGNLTAQSNSITDLNANIAADNNITQNIAKLNEDKLSTTSNVAKNIAGSTNEIVQKEITEDGNTIVQKQDGEWYKEVNKEVKAVEIKERTVRDADNKLVKISDTVSSGMKEITVHVPLTRMELVKLGKLPVEQESQPMILASANRNVTKAEKNVILLEDVKVSRKTYSESSSANEMMHQFNAELNRIFNGNGRFYGGFYLGGNYSPVGTGALGYQLGIAAMMNVGERWTLAAELKYLRRQFVNYYYDDVSKIYDVVQNGNTYFGTESVEKNVYTFNGFSAFELPVYLSYEISDRISIYGGVNGMYLYPLNYEVSKSQSFNPLYASTVEPRNSYLKINDVTDFSPRFGLGYVSGIGFSVSKKVGIDFRITQMMIDNSIIQSPMVNRIARSPSFQLSVGYFIGKRDKVVYMLGR